VAFARDCFDPVACVLPLVPIVLVRRSPPIPRGAGFGRRPCDVVHRARPVARIGGVLLDIDAGMFRLAAAAIMVALGVVLLLPSWQARLAAAGGPVSSWADRHFGSRFASSGLAGQLRSAFCSGGMVALRRPDARRGVAARLSRATICFG